jgi:hypothetical protein
MKRLFGSFLAALLVMLCFVLVPVASAADQPALPDYTKAPFVKNGEGVTSVDLHPEEGRLPVERYVSAPEPRPGASMVLVFRDKEGHLKYAEWTYVNDDGTPTLRYYAYKDEKWHPEQKKE